MFSVKGSWEWGLARGEGYLADEHPPIGIGQLDFDESTDSVFQLHFHVPRVLQREIRSVICSDGLRIVIATSDAEEHPRRREDL